MRSWVCRCLSSATETSTTTMLESEGKYGDALVPCTYPASYSRLVDAINRKYEGKSAKSCLQLELALHHVLVLTPA